MREEDPSHRRQRSFDMKRVSARLRPLRRLMSSSDAPISSLPQPPASLQRHDSTQPTVTRARHVTSSSVQSSGSKVGPGSVTEGEEMTDSVSRHSMDQPVSNMTADIEHKINTLTKQVSLLHTDVKRILTFLSHVNRPAVRRGKTSATLSNHQTYRSGKVKVKHYASEGQLHSGTTASRTGLRRSESGLELVHYNSAPGRCNTTSQHTRCAVSTTQSTPSTPADPLIITPDQPGVPGDLTDPTQHVTMVTKRPGDTLSHSRQRSNGTRLAHMTTVDFLLSSNKTSAVAMDTCMASCDWLNSVNETNRHATDDSDYNYVQGSMEQWGHLLITDL